MGPSLWHTPRPGLAVFGISGVDISTSQAPLSPRTQSRCPLRRGLVSKARPVERPPQQPCHTRAEACVTWVGYQSPDEPPLAPRVGLEGAPPQVLWTEPSSQLSRSPARCGCLEMGLHRRQEAEMWSKVEGGSQEPCPSRGPVPGLLREEAPQGPARAPTGLFSRTFTLDNFWCICHQGYRVAGGILGLLGTWLKYEVGQGLQRPHPTAPDMQKTKATQVPGTRPGDAEQTTRPPCPGDADGSRVTHPPVVPLLDKPRVWLT